jgi:hypothetical protein
MSTEQLHEYLPLLIPLIIAEVILTLTALVSIFRHQHYHFANRVVWVLLAILVQPFGAIAYFLIGREEQ